MTVVRGPFDAHLHPHMAARDTFIELDGVRQPGPAPRFSRTPAQARSAQQDPEAALARWGIRASRQADRLVRDQAWVELGDQLGGRVHSVSPAGETEAVSE